jgi:hypothetical protein
LHIFSLDNEQGPTYIELIPDGQHTLVSRSNRLMFVKSFVKHALRGCVADELDQFMNGLKSLFKGPAMEMCSVSEVSYRHSLL